jgi:hypothetical protein
MEKPEHFILKKRANYRVGCGVGAACFLFLGIALGAGYFSGATVDELALPALVIGIIGGVATVLVLIAIALTVIWERRNIRRLFEKPLWAEWRYAPDEWQRIAQEKLDADRKLFKPGYNLLIGPILGGFIAGIAILVVKDPEVTPILVVVAGVITAIFIVSGLIVPVVMLSNRQARYRKRLRVESPRLYIGAMGVYHETDGFTSLARLGDVAIEYTNSVPVALTFQVYEQVGHYGSYLRAAPIEIPKGREAEAETLARRFQQERILARGSGNWMGW